MLLLVSGEGPSDIGCFGHGEEGQVFQHGPMYLFLDKLFEVHFQYSLLGVDAVIFVHKSELVAAEPKHHGKQFSAPGKRKAKETAYYFENARRLALKATQLHAETERPVIPILFRDADGTQSSGRGEWGAKWESMQNGFLAGHSELGIPMLPQPKSEAWLLCAAKTQPYQHCEALEQESGNDDSPNSLKVQLSRARGGSASAAELNDAIFDGNIDPLRISMASFNAFKDRVNEVAQLIPRN
jgi:hypothetical protein